jgi:hypothetical protein
MLLVFIGAPFCSAVGAFGGLLVGLQLKKANSSHLVKNAHFAKAFSFLFPPAVRYEGREDRSDHERLAIPFTFKPQLSFIDALISIAGALLRIFLGALLFAIWGAYSLAIWFTIRNTFLRVSLLLPLFLVFALSFVLLMLAIRALVRVALRKHPEQPV